MIKPGQLIWSGIKSLNLSQEEKNWIETERISAVILFKRNIVSLPQLHELCCSLYELKHRPLIAMDREGGEVDRLKHLPEFGLWPAPEKLAQVCSPSEIKKTAFYMGKQMQALGVSINFAPCWDLPHTTNPLFAGRLFCLTTANKATAKVTAEKNKTADKTEAKITNKTSDKATAKAPLLNKNETSSSANTILTHSQIELAGKRTTAFLQGLKKAGLACTAKHFPGHGGAVQDSHKEQAIDHRSWQEICRKDLKMFQQALTYSLDLIMTAHVLYTDYDPAYPASLSEKILQNFLKEQLGFKGLIVSDDIDMKGIQCAKNSAGSNVLKPVVIRALKAGVDVLLKCQVSSDNFKMVDWMNQGFKKKQLLKHTMQKKIQKLLQFKQKFSSIGPLTFSECSNIIKDRKIKLWQKELQSRLKDSS